MPVTVLDPRTALVTIDLQRGIVKMPSAHPVDGVIANAARLVQAFRSSGRAIFPVRVSFSADGGDAVRVRTENPPRPGGGAPDPDFAEFVEELGVRDDDLVITKRSWNAFHGTELDLQLRRRGITGIVLAGIATSLGVESTARAARDHGYNLTAAVDAMTDPDVFAHSNTVERILPRIGEVGLTSSILEHLK